MQLQQIAPHTNAPDGPADTARSAHPAKGGEAFGSVFSKDAAGQGSGQTADAPVAASAGQACAAQGSRATKDAEPAGPVPAQGHTARKASAPGETLAGDRPGATPGMTSAVAGAPVSQSGRGAADLRAPGPAALPPDVMTADLAAVPEHPVKRTQSPDDGAGSGAEGAAKQSVEDPEATDTATAETGRPEDLSFATVQMPTPTLANAGSQRAGQPGAEPFGPLLRAAAPGFGPERTGGDLDMALKGGQVPGGKVPDDQVTGDPSAGAPPRGESTGRGVIAPVAVTHQAADTPGQTATASTGAAAAAASGGPGRAELAGPAGLAPRDGVQAPGLAGMQVGGQQAAQAQAGMQGPAPSDSESAVGAAGSAFATVSDRTGGAMPRSADPLTAGAPQAQAGTMPVNSEAPGPRAEGRAAEIARAGANATVQNATAQSVTAQSDTAARPATGLETIMAAQSNVGAGVWVPDGRPVAPASDDGTFGRDPLAVDFGAGEIRGVGRSQVAGPTVLPASTQTPRQVTLQIAEMVRTSGERAVELRLHPEELGRVQMTLSQDATGTLTVALNVERAETLDLLRRNIDLLGADLRALGYESVDFSFQGGGAGDGAGGGAGPDHGAPQGSTAGPKGRETDMAAAKAAGPQHQGRGAGAPGDGIDIRL